MFPKLVIRNIQKHFVCISVYNSEIFEIIQYRYNDT